MTLSRILLLAGITLVAYGCVLDPPPSNRTDKAVQVEEVRDIPKQAAAATLAAPGPSEMLRMFVFSGAQAGIAGYAVRKGYNVDFPLHVKQSN